MAENDAATYRVYPIRWLQLVIYVLGTFANALHNMTFASIQSQTSTFFSITATQVNALATVFLFLYVPGTVLSIWLYRISSMRLVLIVGGVMNLGAFIRLFALISPSQGYAALIIGQIFPALATPLFFNTAPLFAECWFSPKQRDIATAICSMSNLLGLALGTVFPSLIVTNGSSSTSFLTLLLVEGCFTALTTVLIIILFRSAPPSPPSSTEQQHQSLSIKENLMGLLTNRNYLILLLGFSIGLALVNAVTALLYQIIAPTGYSSDDAGILGAVFILAGLANGLLAGVVMDRTHAYRLLLKILLIGACVSILYFILILQPNQLYPLSVSIGLMGFFLIPVLPVAFECAVECTYPISAEWSTGVLLCAGNVLGGIFIFALGPLLTLNPVANSSLIFTPVDIFILCCAVISVIPMLIYNGPYLRLEAERKVVETPSVAI